MERYIDAHAHIWTPDTAHYPLAPRVQTGRHESPLVHGGRVAGNLHAVGCWTSQSHSNVILSLRQ